MMLKRHVFFLYPSNSCHIPSLAGSTIHKHGGFPRPTGVAIIEFSQEEFVGRAAALTAPFDEILGQSVQANVGCNEGGFNHQT